MVVVPFFKNTFILEVERGCANRCGFCLASYINLPIRFVSYDQIIDVIELGLSKTNKIALLGAQVTAHPDFERICDYIHSKRINGENIEMGVSSLRVDSFKSNIVKTLVAAGQKNLTLAIEAGSERLRKVINKNLTEEQRLKLEALYEAENPKPRNREERRRQKYGRGYNDIRRNNKRL